jgi:1,4-alpha-glucan branching enzyme
MYTGMSDLQPASPTIDRGIALQKVPFLLKYWLNLVLYYSRMCSIPSYYIFLIVYQTLQMIHFITMALGGDGYLNFMGNEVNSRSIENVPH